MTLAGKVALVTGSTSGIGLGIARALAHQGADVMLTGFGDPAAIEELRAGLATEYSVRVHYNGADLSDPGQVAAVVAATQHELGGLDILINNAGIQFVSPIEDFPDEKWQAIIALNLSATFYAMKAAIPMMKSKRWGRIVNIASVVGQAGAAGQANYAASKAGLIGLTKALAQEMASRNITVNAVAPGYIATDMTKVLPDEVKAKILASVPLGRMGTPEDIAAAVKFLVSEDASYITGHVLAINGGMYM